MDRRRNAILNKQANRSDARAGPCPARSADETPRFARHIFRRSADVNKLVCCRSCAAALAPVAEFLQAGGAAAGTLLIAPSRGAADDLARQCSPAGALGLYRMTLHQLAAELAAPGMAAEGRTPISRLASEAMCARVAHRLLHDGRIPYFAPVAPTPGFSKALATTLTELRLEKIDPRSLRGSGDAGRDLSALLEAYGEKLDEAGLADLADLLRLASAAAVEGAHRFAGTGVVLLDPPLDSALAREFAAALAAGSPRLLAVTLSGDDRAIAILERIAGAPAVHLDDGVRSSRLDRVRHALFLPQAPEPAVEDDSVDYFSAPGEGMECVEIARRIRGLVAARASFDRIAVLLRDPERYQSFLEEALRRAGIPAFFSRGVARPHPAGRAFLALLACARDGCTATRFSEYLSLGQVPSPGVEAADRSDTFPRQDELLASFLGLGLDGEQEEPPPAPETADADSPVIAGTLQSPIGWEDLLVDAAVIGGVDRWERRLRGLEAELKLQAAALEEDAAARSRIEDQLRHLERLGGFAIPLVRRLHDLPAVAIWGEWLDALEHLARSALREPEPVLAVLSELQSMAEVGPVALDEVIAALSERLRFLRREPPPRRYGRVYVASIDEARARAFDAVFLPGLAEGLFPRKVTEDPLLLDAYRPPGLDRQEDRVRRERLLLHRAVAVASRRLIFSYPRVDVAQSRPRVPSLYALEILRAAMGRLPELREFEKRAAEGAQSRLDWPAPRLHKDAIDDAEYDLVSLERALKNKVRGGVRYLVEINHALGRSLRARAWRWKSRWSYPDGLVDPGDAARQVLAAHALTERSYSASSLQQFAQCPYRFLLHAIHQLRPREAPVALEQMDPLTRGGLFHAVQRDLFVELQAAGLLPVDRQRLNRVRDIADAALDRAAARYEEELAPAIPRVWRGEVEEIRADLHAWLSLAAGQDGWLPVHFELAFGLAADPRRDAASRAEEAILPGGVRLRGSIDLVERHPTRGALRIIDHKTGKAPERPPVYVGGGTSLQPMLYALAAEAVLGERVESSELFYCTQRGNYQRIEASTTDSARLFIARALEIVDLSLREGFLPAAPQPDACDRCDYRPVCGPHELQRSLKKQKDRLEALQELRNMP